MSIPFRPGLLTTATEVLRDQVSSFLAEALPPGYQPGLGVGAAHSPTFSRMLAKQGWVGMAVPSEFGGSGMPALERFVVSEELLAAGAPVNAHWIADRQTAPQLLHFGTEIQQRTFLPRICAGECYFSLGMSEPDSGSDLASVRTSARRTEGGWLIAGTKIWTSGAHLNHYFVVLCRTSASDDRHAGLSQLIVDLSSPGLTVNPIELLDGSSHFNEVVLDDVFVPEEMVLGRVGAGWQQVTSELTYERAGPDRFLSTFALFDHFIREFGDSLPDAARATIGHITSRYWAIRQMSMSVAAAIDAGEAPRVQAAAVKDLGTRFEQDVVAAIHELVMTDPWPDSRSQSVRLLAKATMTAPTFTIRGGTTEVLRTIVARQLVSGARNDGL